MVRPAALVHFHGQPGGPGEWRACAPAGLDAFTPDRNAQATPEALADMVAVHAPGPLTLIGFSLGAPVALAVAAQLGGRVTVLHLVSPAAPLALGNFLPHMAGGPLFRLARDYPALFRLLAGLQGGLARTAPLLLLNRLFATACGDDRALRRDPGFRSAMADGLRAGLGRSTAGFIAEVSAYAAGTSLPPGPVSAPIHIWQGEDDNWTPPAMARALAASLPGASLTMLPGCGHYGTLRAALARIQAQSPA